MKNERYPHKLRREFVEVLLAGSSPLVGLLHHADSDGVCGAVLTAHLLSQQTATVVPRSVATADFDFETVFRWLEAHSFDRVGSLDINYLSTEGALETLRDSAGCPVVVYDDHALGDEIVTFENLRYINPHRAGLDASAHAPACGFAYSLLQDVRIAGASAAAVCMVGLVGEGVAKSFTADFPELSDLTNRLRPIAYDVNSAYSLPEGHSGQSVPWELLADVLRQDSPTITAAVELLETHPLRERLTANAAMIDSEVRRTVSSLDRRPNVQTASGLRIHLLHFGSPYAIVNWVASQVRQRTKPGLVVAMQDMPNGRTQIELRRSRGLKEPDVSGILRSLDDQVAYISRGGHPPAAGATIPTEQLEPFISAFKAYATEHL